MYVCRLKKLLHKTRETKDQYEYSKKFDLKNSLNPSEGCLCLSDLKYLYVSSLICLLKQGLSRELHPINLRDRKVKLKPKH
jgi:hypothetical protein